MNIGHDSPDAPIVAFALNIIALVIFIFEKTVPFLLHLLLPPELPTLFIICSSTIIIVIEYPLIFSLT